MSDSTWWFRQQAFMSHGTTRRVKKRSLYKCSNDDCTQRTTKNQAKGSKGHCPYCKSKLRAWQEFQ